MGTHARRIVKRSGLPEFACIPGSEIGAHDQSGITMILSKNHVEEAYRSARAGIPADPPIIEAIIPSTIDDTLTDKPGTHVMSLLCKYMPYDLADGKQWDTEKEGVVKNILTHLTRYRNTSASCNRHVDFRRSRV